jgi:hypothetical protein
LKHGRAFWHEEQRLAADCNVANRGYQINRVTRVREINGLRRLRGIGLTTDGVEAARLAIVNYE